MKHRITYADIAGAAGVDKSTVSLALSGHPRIPEATRVKIRAVAERLGYVPDPALATLAAHRWQGRRDHKGLVLAFVCDNLLTAEPELKAYLAGVKKQAALLGYGVEVFSLSDYPSVAALQRVVNQRNLRGMVIGQSRSDLPEELLAAGEPPRVHCGFLRDVPCDTVRSDLASAVNLAWRRLGGGGRRVVFGLEVERGLHSDHALLGAARAMAEAAGNKGPKVVIGWLDRDEDDWLARLKKACEKADALVVLNGKQRDRVRKAGVVAGGATVAQLHQLAGESGPGVDLRLEEVGRVAVNLLELKMRRLPLATAAFRQTLEVEPRWRE